MIDTSQLRLKWQGGEPSVNAWLSMPCAVSAEVMALQGFDSVTIDLQHGLIDYQSALAMLQATSSSGSTPLVRLPWLEPSVAMRVLDAGAAGVICPSVNSAEDAKTLVEACRYPPTGSRSVGPTRVGLYLKDYLRKANESVLVIAQIESRQAVASIDEILGVPGLDAIYVGPADLALSMGREPKVDHEDEAVIAALEAIVAAARRHGMVAGIHCASVSYAHRMIALGYQMVTVQNDLRLLAMAAAGVIAGVRNVVPDQVVAETPG